MIDLIYFTEISVDSKSLAIAIGENILDNALNRTNVGDVAAFTASFYASTHRLATVIKYYKESVVDLKGQESGMSNIFIRT